MRLDQPTFLLVTAERSLGQPKLGPLHAAVRQSFPKSKCRLLAADATTAKRELASLQDETVVLVLDAHLPRADNLPPDGEEEAAAWLLNELRASGDHRPAIVLTRHTADNALRSLCSPRNNAIALPLSLLTGPVLAGFLGMLGAFPEPTWKVIEVEVTERQAYCFLCDVDGGEVRLGSVPLSGYSTVARLAHDYVKPAFERGWSRKIHADGVLLFKELVQPVLGSGLISHLENAAGGLEKLAFRFRVDDARLYTAPFEATVRLSAQSYLNSDADFEHHPFVLVSAPITRRVGTVPIRGSISEEKLPVRARLLIVRAQLGEHPNGATKSVTVPIADRDPLTGASTEMSREFAKLIHTDVECYKLEELAACSEIIVAPLLDLSAFEHYRNAEAALATALAKSARYDIVHFVGHSLTTRGGVTHLILPGAEPGEGKAVPVGVLADGAMRCGARLVYLSSCEGSSAHSVASLAQRGVPHILGFRWEVADDRAVTFATNFYTALVQQRATICRAFQAACKAAHPPPHELDLSPIWASPILASQAKNWSLQRFLAQQEQAA